MSQTAENAFAAQLAPVTYSQSKHHTLLNSGQGYNKNKPNLETQWLQGGASGTTTMAWGRERDVVPDNANPYEYSKEQRNPSSQMFPQHNAFWNQVSPQ